MPSFVVSPGTAIVVKNSGGNYGITLASLGAGAARQSAKIDLGATWARRWSVRCQFNMDVAPVNGAPVNVWWSSSKSATAATDNTGAASGADAAYTGSAGGGLATTKYQLQLIGVMPMTNDADTVVQIAEFAFEPLSRYGSLVIENGTAQAFEGDEDSHQITLTPLTDVVA